MSSGVLPFAVLVLEREPLTVEELPILIQSWLQDAGGFAAVGLGCWWLLTLLAELGKRSSPDRKSLIWGRAGGLLGQLGQQASGLASLKRWPSWLRLAFTFASACAGLCYAPIIAAMVLGLGSLASEPYPLLLTVGGTFALIAVLVPFLHDLVRWRGRRIWAIARLSATEVWRRKIHLVFLALLAVALFADWFMPHKAEDQLRSYVELVYFVVTVLLVLTMAVLASFSIPSDISHQTIHTIVTKPVERFELVLGRFLGYTFVMSLILGAITLLSLLYLAAHGVHPDAEFESYRARVPLYGDLGFRGRQADFRGESVGREWAYRRYIAGGANSSQRAVWAFQALPSRLEERPDVPCEFAFDVFRTRRPDREGQGVSCTFRFMSRAWFRAGEDYQAYQRERKKLEERNPPPTEAEVAEQLAAKYGLFEYRSKEIHDYHTMGFRVPASLFQNARAAATPPDGYPVLWVEVKCETPSQFVGVAKRDLYLLDAEGYFGVNFFKGAAGIWFELCLVIGVAVACGTYLSGVIALMCALFFFALGLFRADIADLALGRSEGGGPVVAFHRLLTNTNLVTPLDPTPTVQVATALDDMFRWFLQRFLNVVPDVERYDMTNYVANGFDIPLVSLGLHALVLFGYLFPWALLAYYLMNSREVAS